MNKYVKYLKALLYIFIPLFIFNIVLSILYYFDVIEGNTLNILNLVITIISVIIGGIYIGNKAEKKGYLEGLKLGFIISLIFLLMNFIIFKGLNTKSLIYYLALILISTFGSMIGISTRKNG